MVFSVETIPRLNARRGARRRFVAICVALGVALAAGGGAMWLLAAGSASPWTDAFIDLTNSGEMCRAEGDATAHAAARVTRSYGQLDSFVRQRFDEILSQARLAQERSVRDAESRAASQQPIPEPSEAAKLEARMAELIGERLRLLERLTPQHPSIIDVEQQIAELDHQRTALAPTVEPMTEQISVAPSAEMSPAAAWRELVEHTMAEYAQLAASCRRNERQFDEAHLGQSTALNSHLAALERWSGAASFWHDLSTAPAAIGSSLWAVAGIALIYAVWLVAGRAAVGTWPGNDVLITSAAQIERWFSLPVVAVSAAGNERPAASRRQLPRWLVLPAQVVVAVAVFCLVATTIENPTWIGQLWAR